jgi:transcriptional regulator with GAF, ATPase, and Fis domain
VTATGKHYLAEDVTADEFYRPHPLLPETRSELAIPLKIGDRVIGALDIQHRQSRGLREEEIDVLHILADQLAISVQNALLFEEALARAERERAVAEIGSRFRASDGVEEILRTSIREVGALLGSSKAKIYIQGRLRPPIEEQES